MDAFYLMSLLAVVAAPIAVGAVIIGVGQSRRIDALSRRQSYETECLVKSIQELEQQNLILQQRLNAVIGVSQKLADRITKVPTRPEDEQTQDPIILNRSHLH